MSDEVADAPDSQIRVPANASMKEAIALTQQLRQIDVGETLVLDASGVENISTPYILAIVSAINARSEITPPAKVANPTNTFVDGFSDLGLYQDLMKMEFVT